MQNEQTPAAGPLTAESPVPAQHPMMIAWTAYSEGDEYANSARWAVQPEHTKGAMWAAFCSGWSAGTRHVASPASSSSVVQGEASGVERESVEDLWRELCERDDRTSPAEYPEMCLIAFDEFSDFINRAAPVSRPGAPDAGGGWMPIETAPKDAEFRCLLAHAYSVVTGYWDGDGWRNERSVAGHHFPATHWMPLSAPPALQPGGER